MRIFEVRFMNTESSSSFLWLAHLSISLGEGTASYWKERKERGGLPWDLHSRVFSLTHTLSLSLTHTLSPSHTLSLSLSHTHYFSPKHTQVYRRSSDRHTSNKRKNNILQILYWNRNSIFSFVKYSLMLRVMLYTLDLGFGFKSYILYH